jgi:2'-5' RNA ligase
MNNLFSVWLVPEEKDNEYLRTIVDNLAKQYSSPVFSPHLTLAGSITSSLEEAKNAVDEVFKKTRPFKIRKTKLNQSELFFKTVFIELELDDNLKNLYIAFAEKIKEGDISTFKPHISLIYKLMSEQEKLKIIEKLSIKDEFTIEYVTINAPRAGAKDFMDVEGWRTVYKRNLISS